MAVPIREVDIDERHLGLDCAPGLDRRSHIARRPHYPIALAFQHPRACIRKPE
jgi:hypothetical protein